MALSWNEIKSRAISFSKEWEKDIVYNNYPFPKNVSDKNKLHVKECAKEILTIRETFKERSLADLYDPLAMPPTLKKAHQALDKAVDKYYTNKTFKNNKERIEFLFGLHERYLKE